MGLDYLNKKVWHPGSMKNIQKVWDAQQAELQIIKRQRQRAKKLQEDQYKQEMKKIQVEAGLIPRSHLERMDWMYDWGNKVQQQKNNEDFLTGAQKASKKESKHVFQQETTNKRCEDFVLLHEDPMYQIQKGEARARQSIMNNPIEMKSIIQEVEEDYLKAKRLEKNGKSQDKGGRTNQGHKKEKKKSKRRSRSPSSSSSSSSSRSSSSSKQRSRSRSKKSKNSKLYEDYLKSKFGSILVKNEEGQLVPDYGMHKKKYKTEMQLTEEERQAKINEMRENAKKIRKERQASESPDRDHYRKHQK